METRGGFLHGIVVVAILFFPLVILSQNTNAPFSFRHEISTMYDWPKNQALTSSSIVSNKAASFIGKCLGYDYYAVGTVPGSYVLVAKADYLYDIDGNMQRAINFQYNGSGWTPSSKDTVVYDVNGNVVSRELFISNGGIYTPLQRLDYTYNTLNLVTEQLVLSWVNGQYVAQAKYENYYSGSQLDSIRRSSDQGSGLALFRITKNTFDASGNIIEQKIYEIQAGQRVLTRTNYRTYANGLQAMEYQETYYGLGPDTTGVGSFYYDANGNDTLIYFEQTDSTGVLMPNSRQRTTWDVNNNERGLTLEFYQNGIWDLFFESRTGVDLNFAASDIMYPPELTEGFRVNNKLEWIYNYVNVGATLSEDSLVYRYNSFISVAELEQQMSIQVFPNPFVDFLSVTINEPSILEIISVKGEVLFRQEFETGKHDWDLSGLPSGSYFLRVSQGEEIKTTQLLKQ